MSILFRCDSSYALGLGHMMRCLVLAKEYPKEAVHFACRDLDGNINSQIPYPLHVVPSNEPEEIIKLILALHVEMLIIDHYGINYEAERKIKEKTGVKILVLDDTYEKHCCDIVRNPNLCADASRYEGLVPSHCELQCGIPLIREEFYREKACAREKITDIFLAMGGADTANLSIPILNALPKTLHVSVLTTSANKNLATLQAFVKTTPNVTLHVNSEEVAKLLHQSRFAIISPSTLVHEVLFMDVPFLAIKTAPNQADMVAYLQAQGYPTMDRWDEALFEHTLRSSFAHWHL
ncbi:MAG: UDP-2,4-diacetamido-2,4,6-trideoxy-beta-L-altropyranose hydrolase [Campylobacterales bacterium]|nr:UDP-2,4-diacetamido-2,4,6-trideoxy-beta-L-altropyranose hydrolase [Campylobacterales bacterium]